MPERVEGFHLAAGAEIFDDPRFTDVTAYPDALWKRPARRSPTAPRSRHGARGVNATARADYDRRCSSSARRTWPSRRTSPASPRTGRTCPAGAGTTARRTCAGAAAAADHRVHEQRPDRGPGIGQPLGRPDELVQRVLGRVLDVRLVLVPQVRTDAPVLAAGAGLPAEGGQGHLGGRHSGPRRPRTQNFRDLRDRRDPAVPRRPRHRPPPVGAQRGAGGAGRSARPDVPIVALHLTRPAVEIPDRAALGMASHFEAARGAYLIREPDPDRPRGGTVYVQGTATTANWLKVLPSWTQRT